MDYLDRELLIYLGIILVFLIFFLWNKRRIKSKRNTQKNRSFRQRFEERKNKD